ncbi:Tetratricopeptide TPR_2 repeat protein [Candidatus Methylopumilus turicensis]|uniref:Tetratricopeptide TPR_2 repeat protein n=2 Tax=Candidatus Methylopumilus turicensis TaxID=1581680 RepID=A0A0B7IT09_9PROT|nr:Tetratricopeptide TPR_2 repeat protein [Candidatus Methylopumilus turicensis]
MTRIIHPVVRSLKSLNKYGLLCCASGAKTGFLIESAPHQTAKKYITMVMSRTLSIRLLLVLILSFSSFVNADDLKDIAQQASQGQPSAAMERVNNHISANPNDVQALFMRGVMLAEQGKKDEAIKAFTDITQRFPALPEPYNNLAVLYADQGQFDKAKQALESAIKTHPSYATAHENLGDIYSKMASEAYGKALQLDTANARAQNKLLLIKDLLSASGKTASAISAKPAHINTTTLPATPDSAYGNKVADSIKSTEPGKTNTKLESSNDVGRADTQSVVTAVNKWASAWSNKDINAYLDAYADGFKTPDGLSRKAWEAMRRERINKPGKIEVSVSNINVHLDDSSHATASFKQSYHSGNLSQKTSKVLVFVFTNGKWLIVQEKANH